MAGAFAPFLLGGFWPPKVLPQEIIGQASLVARLGKTQRLLAGSNGFATVSGRALARVDIVGNATVTAAKPRVATGLSGDVTGRGVATGTLVPPQVLTLKFDGNEQGENVDFVGFYNAFFNGNGNGIPILRSEPNYLTAYAHGWQALAQEDDLVRTDNTEGRGFTSGYIRSPTGVSPSSFQGNVNQYAGRIGPALKPRSLFPGYFFFKYSFSYEGFDTAAVPAKTRPDVANLRLTVTIEELNTAQGAKPIGSYVFQAPSWNVTSTEAVGNTTFTQRRRVVIPTVDLEKIENWSNLRVRFTFTTLSGLASDVLAHHSIEWFQMVVPGLYQIPFSPETMVGTASLVVKPLILNRSAFPKGAATVTADLRKKKNLRAAPAGSSTTTNVIVMGRAPAGTFQQSVSRGSASVQARVQPVMQARVNGSATASCRELVPQGYGGRPGERTTITAGLTDAKVQVIFPGPAFAQNRAFDQNNFGSDGSHMGGKKIKPRYAALVDQVYTAFIHNKGEARAFIDAFLHTWETSPYRAGFVTTYTPRRIQVPAQMIPIRGNYRARTNQTGTAMYLRVKLWELDNPLLPNTVAAPTENPAGNNPGHAFEVQITSGGLNPGPWREGNFEIGLDVQSKIVDWTKVALRVEGASGAPISGGGQLDISWLSLDIPNAAGGIIQFAAKINCMDVRGKEVSGNVFEQWTKGDLTTARNRKGFQAVPVGVSTVSVPSLRINRGLRAYLSNIPLGYDTQYVFGDLTVANRQGGVVRDLVSPVQGAASASGRLAFRRVLAVRPAGVASVAAGLTRGARAQVFAGSSSGSAIVAGAMTRVRTVPLAATCSSSAVVTARISLTAGMEIKPMTRVAGEGQIAGDGRGARTRYSQSVVHR